jgi:dihydroorotate dehydrogenase (NAD+) catalytic subunit
LCALAIGGRRGASLELTSPVLVASGCFGRRLDGQQRDWLRGVGALVTHTITPEAHMRGAFPYIGEAVGGVLYATGLPNRGFATEVAASAGAWAAAPLPIVVSIAAHDRRALAGMAADLNGMGGVAAIELNAQMYIDASANGEPSALLAGAVAAVASVTALPLIVKLPPLPDPLAAGLAALEAGADALCVSHGWPARPAWDTADGVLLAGPAILPLTLRLVGDLVRAGALPIIACGGVASEMAARACLDAGACAVQVGSALFRDPRLAVRIAAALDPLASGGIA